MLQNAMEFFSVQTSGLFEVLFPGLPRRSLSLAPRCDGAFIHASTADLLAERVGERGLLASDLIVHLPEVINA